MPKKLGSKPLDAHILIRCTAEDRERYRQMAKAKGISLSALVRARLDPSSLFVACDAQERADYEQLAARRKATIGEIVRAGLEAAVSTTCVCDPTGGPRCRRCRSTTAQ